MTQAETSMAGAAVNPFRINVPEEELVDLRQRIAATRWPSKELVEDRSQGVRLATLQELARYWETDYDFGRVEARLTFEKMSTYANHLGLYSEEIGLTGEQLGNFPQAFSHLALINAALDLDSRLDHDPAESSRRSGG
jgi:hypothetical protein